MNTSESKHMDRYTVETNDPYDMELDPSGMWVMYDDVQAAIAEAVAKDRARIAEAMRNMVRILRLPDEPQYAGDERHTEKRMLLAMADATEANSWPTASPIAAERDGTSSHEVRSVTRQAPNWWHCDTHGPGKITAWGCPECVREMRRDLEENEELRERMADILRRTAVALRGPEPPLTLWSWHDLPERAAAAVAAIDVMQRAARIEAEALAMDAEENAMRYLFVRDSSDPQWRPLALRYGCTGREADALVDAAMASHLGDANKMVCGPQ